jgi:dipeptidyl aminopeptidase/acylaminoacyl peptidase
MKLRHALPCLLVLVAAPVFAREAAHPTAEDVVRLVAPSDLQISPDGTRALFVRSAATFDSTAKPSEDDTKAGWTRDRQVWLVELGSGQMRALTSGDAAASNPRWSPDGRTVAFVRRKGEHSRIWLLPLQGGEPRALETGALDPGGVEWSPDGRVLAFTASDPLTDAETRARWQRGGAQDWGREYRNDRVWIVSAEGGKARAVTAPGVHVTSYAWAPEGRRFALLTASSADPYIADTFEEASIVDTLGHPVGKLVRAPSSYSAMAWSPDGRTVALLGLNGGLSNFNALLLWDVAGSAAHDLAPDPNRTFDNFAWDPDGKSIVVSVKAMTRSQLLRFPLSGAAVALPFAGRVLTSAPKFDREGHVLAFLSSTPRSPDDLTLLDLAQGRTRVVTTLNPQVASWPLGNVKLVHWTNHEGTALEGLLLVAPSSRPNAPAPLIVMPHGGPDDVSMERFSGLAQYFASRGYSVFFPNYRGGTGYGFAFYAANRNRFGEIEQADIESGVDALIAAHDADPKKLYFGGWSWGGYITAWMLGHTTRYRAMVAGAAVSDVTLQYSLSDINHGDAAQWEYQGNPWKQLDHFDRPNPIRYAKDMKTPTLILHGESDNRVGFPASVELYRALADQGVEVRFYAYPREDHGFVEPAHRAHYYRAWADWYDAH